MGDQEDESGSLVLENRHKSTKKSLFQSTAHRVYVIRGVEIEKRRGFRNEFHLEGIAVKGVFAVSVA
jgi:hypothetical protein